MKKENKWLEEYAYSEKFKKRYGRLINLLEDENYDSVLDLGCGVQYLRDIIPDVVYYTGVDLYQHKQDTLICDFNKGEFAKELDKYDLVVTAGLLEYIYELNKLIENIGLATGKYYLCSYHFKEFTPKVQDIWVEELCSMQEFIRLADENGLRLVKFYTKIRKKEENRATIMLFEKIN